MSRYAGYLEKPKGWVKPEKRQTKLDELEKKADDVRSIFFSGEVPFLTHVKLLSDPESYSIYMSVLLVLLHQNCELQFSIKWKVIASCWAVKRYDLADYLLHKTNQFNLPEVLKAVKFLDLPRQIRALNKKIRKLEKCGAKRTTVQKVRTKITELEKEAVPSDQFKTVVNGSLAKRIRTWVGKFSESELSFFSIQMPKEPWKELADIVHFSPKNFKLDYFLPVAFGAVPPQDSMIARCESLSMKNVEEIVTKYQVPYSYLRKTVPKMSARVKEIVSKYEKIDTLVWYYEEFTSNGSKEEIDRVLEQRLRNGEKPSLNYGKLLERILYFKMNGSIFYRYLFPIAEEKLKEIDLRLEKPFYIFGDASGSMSVCVRTSTIIASFITCITPESKLYFFNKSIFEPKIQPKTIDEVIDVALTTKAKGRTAPAEIVKHFYEKKEKVKVFLMVTDEVENVKVDGTYFAQWFYKYSKEVFPAKLVMVSFLKNPSQFESGQMFPALKALGIEPVIFSMHLQRPDLQKLDKLVGLLSLETKSFLEVVKDVHGKAKVGGLKSALTVLKKNRDGAEEEEEEENEGEEEDVGNNVISSLKVDNDAPNDFLCPITKSVMKDPVIASDGFSYERSAILKWIKKKSTSPMTGSKLSETIVFPNQVLKNKIKEYLEKNEKEKND